MSKNKKSKERKGYMTQNITTSQVINEHCSCCHGNYYHSNVANGIWGRAREICENYCQIQLGSFRLNSAVRPPGPSLISYQIEREIGMLEFTPWCESHHWVLTPADWGRLTPSSNLNQHHCWHISVSRSAAFHWQQGCNCSDNTGALAQFTPLFRAESVKGRKKRSSAQIASRRPFSLTWLNEKSFIPTLISQYCSDLKLEAYPAAKYRGMLPENMFPWQCQQNGNHFGQMGRWLSEREQVKNSVDV